MIRTVGPGHEPSRRDTTLTKPCAPTPPDHDLSFDGLQVIEALPHSAALIGPDGTILHVNESWRRFARKNGAGLFVEAGAGIDYLEVCRNAGAVEVLAGVQAVLAGEGLVVDGAAQQVRAHEVGDVARARAGRDPIPLPCRLRQDAGRCGPRAPNLPPTRSPPMPAWLLSLDHHFPIRYLTLALCAVMALLGAFAWVGFDRLGWMALLGAAGVATGVHDLRQARHAVLRNYPVIGHFRFLLEWIRPEIRQYFLESDSEAVPLSR